jgi:hypothetical protein
MGLVEMKLAAITEINKINNEKDLRKVLSLLSKITLIKENNPADLTQHYEIAKKRHKEIINKLAG